MKTCLDALHSPRGFMGRGLRPGSAAAATWGRPRGSWPIDARGPLSQDMHRRITTMGTSQFLVAILASIAGTRSPAMSPGTYDPPPSSTRPT